MIVVLLIIIACVLLFGAQETKAGIWRLLILLFVLGIIVAIVGSCG